jgi:uncharacterized protein (TIGR02145 family)
MDDSHLAADSSSSSKSEDPGQVSLSIDLGPVGVLARTAQMTPTRLVLRFVSSNADTVRDTQLISGRSAIAKVYSLASQRQWTLNIVGRDQRDSILYSGTKAFDVLPRTTTDVGLSLDAGYSSIRVHFPVLDSMTRFVLRVDGAVWVDSTVAMQKRVGDTIKADHDYLSASSAGVAHPFSFRVYGKPWGIDTLLYSLDTTLNVVSGQSATRVLTLKWAGIKVPPSGAADLQVTLGSVGQLVFQVGYGDSSDYGIPWNSKIDYGSLVDPRDGQSYRTIKIGTQTWMAQNLNFAGSVDKPLGVCYDGKPEMCNKFGRLYNWGESTEYASPSAGNIRGICPFGWHVPSGLEWRELPASGTALASSAGWSGANGTDEFGFRVLPAGEVYSTGEDANSGSKAVFWTSTYASALGAYKMEIAPSQTSVPVITYKTNGYSLRCVKD